MPLERFGNNPNHEYILTEEGNLQSREVAKKYLYDKDKDKYTKPFGSYIVHHIDGDTFNNSIRNLYICTKEEHDWIHGEQIRKKRKFENSKQIDIFLINKRAEGNKKLTFPEKREIILQEAPLTKEIREELYWEKKAKQEKRLVEERKISLQEEKEKYEKFQEEKRKIERKEEEKRKRLFKEEQMRREKKERRDTERRKKKKRRIIVGILGIFLIFFVFLLISDNKKNLQQENLIQYTSEEIIPSENFNVGTNYYEQIIGGGDLYEQIKIGMGANEIKNLAIKQKTITKYNPMGSEHNLGLWENNSAIIVAGMEVMPSYLASSTKDYFKDCSIRIRLYFDKEYYNKIEDGNSVTLNILSDAKLIKKEIVKMPCAITD